jgi:uncharacterized protein YodC (DUF2158 family)
MEFTAGEIVELKSGDPDMTVEEIGTKPYTEEPAVWCVWFEKVGNKNVLQRESFPPIVLKKSGLGSGSMGSIRASRL